MNVDDALFALPEQPASVPRIRMFAELALKEIRMGERVSNLMSDKQAFSEFMYKINESVLLGLRGPPTASSVINSDEDISDGEASSDQQPPSSSAGLPSQSFDVDSDEGFSNPVAFPNKWAPAPREHVEIKAHGSSAARPPPPRSSRLTVRFDVDGGERRPGTRLRGKLRGRKEREAAESRPPAGETAASDEPALRGDLDGASLLQELRSRRSQALAEIGLAPPPGRQSTSPSARPSISTPPSPSYRFASTQRTSPSRRLPPSTMADRVTTALGGAMPVAQRPVEEALDWERREAHVPTKVAPVVSVRGGEAREREKRAADKALAGAVHSEASDGRGQSEAQVQDVPPSNRGWEVTAVSAHAGRPWFSGSIRGSEGRPRDPGEHADGERGVEEGRMELSLDLSDCSDEKLGSVLERGPLRTDHLG